MLITKEKLNLAKYAGCGEGRYALDNLFFDKNKAVASNNHYMIQVEDTPPPQENFPTIEGMDNTSYVPDKVLVTVNTATRVSKNIPTYKKLPILQNADMEVDAKGNIKFGITDLESSMVINQRKIEGQYPNTGDTIPVDAPQSAVKVDIQYLRKIVNALSEFTKTGMVEISLRGYEGPMICQCKKDDATMTTLIMPLKS